MNFDLQLFAEDLNIPGIDADVLAELNSENNIEETVETAEEPAEAPKPEESAVEADNVNKQVEEETGEEEVKEGQTIPYERFKSINDRRKTAENRIKELEEKLKSYETAPKAAPEQQDQQPAPAQDTYGYTAEQRKKIGELAIQRVKQKLNLTDEDVEAMEYSDDLTDKLMYDKAISNEIDVISREIQDYKSNQERQTRMFADNANRFEQLSAKVTAYPDAQARLNFILNENFNTLDAEYKDVLQEAYGRLQAKRGTNADYRLIQSYFKEANRRWEKSNETAQPAANNTNSKITQAQRLPKAPNITGGSGTDKTYTVAELTELLNSPDGWESLPEKVRHAILNGNLPY